jgi:predicted metal-binding membrane protein
VTALLALAGAAWAGTAIRMSGMDAGPGTDPGSLGFYITSWTVMMVAMMVPSAIPAVLSARDRRPLATAAFVAEYVAVWAAAGLLAYGALKLGRSLPGAPFAWHRAGRWTAAGVLLIAATYELTPIKRALLRRCKGEVAMGARNGFRCVGCCWALMAALFALGAMNLIWMVVVTAIVAAQKFLPATAATSRATAALLAALGIALAVAPAQVPGLTVPGSPAAMRAMTR